MAQTTNETPKIINQARRRRNRGKQMFPNERPSTRAEVEAELAKRNAERDNVAKLVVDNAKPASAVDDAPITLNKVALTAKQKSLRDKLTNKEQQTIASADLLSENGAWAWLSNKHETDGIKNVEIAKVFAGMERGRVDEAPFGQFVDAVAQKWPQLKPKWLRDHRAIAAALVKAKENEGKKNGGDTNIVGVHSFKETVGHGITRLRDANRENPILFKTGTELARVDIVAEEDSCALNILSQQQFGATLNAQVEYFKSDAEGNTIGISAPMDVLSQLYSMPSSSLELPYLKSVTRIPTLSEAGKIVQTPGYNEDAQVFYKEQADLDIPYVSANPTEAQTADAVHVLKDIIADFPFEGHTREENMEAPCASMTNTIALMLQSFVRPAYAGPCMGTLITKPAVGTGATLLASICQIIVSGVANVRPPFSNSEEEIRKMLFTAIKSQEPLLIFDNLSGMLDSPTLAMLLTSTIFTDRELGRSAERSLPVVSGVVFTGNNPLFSTELQRRLSLIRLDAQMANPKGREGFKYPDLLQHVSENRGEIIAAILTLIASWVAAGKPAPTNVPKIASYDGWSTTIGGILENVGFSTFQANRADIEKLASSGDEDPIEDLVRAWYEAAKDPKATAFKLKMGIGGDAGLISIAAANELALPVRKNPQATDAFDYNPTDFGKFLSPYADRYFEVSHGVEVRLVKGKRSKHGNTWELVPK
jgi:hypothetical protein